MLLTVFGYLFIITVVGVGAVYLLRKVFPQWFHLARTKKTQADDYAATIDPAGQMRQAALDAAAELKGADEALTASDTLQRGLKRQIEADAATANKLRGQVALQVRPKSEGGKGLSETDPLVVEKLKRIRDAEASVATNQGQLDDQIKVYERTLKQANKAGEKIAATIAEADRLKVSLQLGEKINAINAMIAKYNPAGVNSKLAEVDKYRQAAQQKLDGFAAQAKVAADRGQVNDDDEDDVSPLTDPTLAGILDGIKQGSPVKPKTAPLS